MAVNPYFLQSSWFIDPQNVSGTASNGNTGLTSGTALRTWSELQARWGTVSPPLRQNTTITFLSSHTDNTDPVDFRPSIQAGAVVQVAGTTPTVVTAGVVLAGTVAKSRAGNQLLNTNLGATGAAAQMVQNTTGGKSSRSWAYRALGANVFAMAQPLAPVTVPPSAPPAEVDTWANGDTVNLLTLVAVNLVRLEATLVDYNGAFDNFLQIYQLAAFDPLGAGNSLLRMTDHIQFSECQIQRILHLTNNNGDAPSGLYNCAFLGGIIGGQVLTLQAIQLIGGYFPSGSFFRVGGGNIALDGDIIFGRGSVCPVEGGGMGFVAVDQAGTVFQGIGSNDCTFAAGNYGGAALYGNGALRVTGTARLVYPTGAGQAAATLLLSGAITINGSATAHSVISGAPDVFNGGITLTPAHLDAAAGAAGFGGNAFIPNGGAISNLF